jgi:tryptophan synthase alpha chain
MGRIEQKFDELRSFGRKGFIPFVTAGDPTFEASLSIVRALADAGADIIELGVPFSDPMADGPTIQRSSQRSLLSGISLSDVLRLARKFRKTSDIPIVLFSYLNPLLAYGVERSANDAAAAGIDGILITDAVDEEAATCRTLFGNVGIDLISLVAPTTSEARLKNISESATGFIYAVSRAGVTGAQAETSRAAEELVERTRRYTHLPIAVGFGISTSRQIGEVWRYADAAVVGSAIVAEIERNLNNDKLAGLISQHVSTLLPSVAKTPVRT